MNDLGMTLAWSAIQVTFVLVPAAVLHAQASRRSPASGSWIATVGLALGVVIGATSLIPSPRREHAWPTRSMTVDATQSSAVRNHEANPRGFLRHDAIPREDAGRLVGGMSHNFDRFLRLWRRLEPGQIVPTARFRRWGSMLAIFAIPGIMVGVIRLLAGLWAVRLCQRRGTVVSDPPLIDLCDQIRLAIGCYQRVEIREVPELTAPATAGWRRPVIMLPVDWRSWDDTDRRAVLAHELAHVHRGDYAAGLIARLALALEFYHPLVHWMARRLQFQQELAADALGARFAGGSSLYLLTLSSLALKQDGLVPSWPARAFLPARGTLIRRIAMLQNDSKSEDRPWSNLRRLASGLCLLAVAVGAAMLRGPASADERAKPNAAIKTAAPAAHDARKAGATPFDVRYVSDDAHAMVAFRPAATFRRTGTPTFSALSVLAGLDLSDIANQLKVDLAAPGRLQLAPDDIEWVIVGLDFGRSMVIGPDGKPLLKGAKDAKGETRHAIQTGRVIVRATGPFDWLKFLSDWRFEFIEVPREGRTYFKITGIMKTLLGSNPASYPCVYLPDDRTIVFDDESAIKKMLDRPIPAVPEYLAGGEWARFSRGILALAINNQDGKFAKSYDLGQPDDAVFLSLFKGVDRWLLGVDDTDAIALHAEAFCQGNASQSIARSVDSMAKMVRDSVPRSATAGTPTNTYERADRMFAALVTNLRVRPDDQSVDLHSDGIGTLAEFGAVMAGVIKEQARQAGIPMR